MKNLNELVRNAQQGNEIAMRTLHEQKTELIKSLATYYARICGGIISAEELENTGHSAIEYAVKTYNKATFVNFKVHAYFMIRDYMKDTLLVRGVSCMAQAA